MKETIDAQRFGLPNSTMIEKIENGHFAILIFRKSRIIMKDGVKLLAKTEKIRAREPTATISLKTSAPICSKTRKFLEDNHITIIAV